MRRRKFFQLCSTFAAGSLWPRKNNFSPIQSTAKKAYAGSMDPWVEVDLKAIVGNWHKIKNHTGVKVMAVVKANAYGHGLIEVARSLEKVGVDGLMVGKLEEAIILREAGLRCPILNFGPFDRSDAGEIIRQRISQSVFTEEAFYLEEAAARIGLKGLIHLDIDTGMGRTGIPHDQALSFIEKLASCPHLRLEGIATTLTEDIEFDREQVRRLNNIYTAARKKGINCGLRHAASSAGLLASAEFNLDMVRPGITIYGYYPNAQTQKEDLLDLRPSLRLKARVIFIKNLRPGETLSYHRVFKAERPMRVATLGIGYSDGYPTQLGGQSWAIIKGQKYRVLPLITANHLMLELQDHPEIKIGDEAILIDSEKGSVAAASFISATTGISPYRLLIGINPLLPRHFL